MLTYLTPGPSELYFTVEQHVKTALRAKVGSISHRSTEFKKIYAHTVEQLRILLDIPEEYVVVFSSSANEIWERMLQNCVENQSFHFVNGAFSKKFLSFAEQLQLKTTSEEVGWGEGFNTELVKVPAESELIALALNETSTGVRFPTEDLKAIRDQNPEKLLAVDATSALPTFELDIAQTDATYFSVQKGFGLPAGLGVWIASPRMIERAATLETQGKVTGTYHRLTQWAKRSLENQTPETPNVLGIYLLGKVCEDMNTKGREQIQREAKYKATLLYHTLNGHPFLRPFVKEKKWQSPTVIVAELTNDNHGVSDWIKYIEKNHGLLLGTGYGKYKSQHLRIANFPTHSKERIEQLSDILNAAFN
ncbi:MAG: aminotransferase class V-fold PLP-dependent enzyme [Bacteroidota bacterium]